MIVVAGFNIPNFHRYCVGMTAIGLIGLHILVNTVRWVTFFIRPLYLRCKRFMNRCKHKAIMKKRKDSKTKVLDLISVETERGLISTLGN